MKRVSMIICAFLALTSIVLAQDGINPEFTANAQSTHYEVKSDLGSEDAVALAREMDQRFGIYNELFHFDPALLPGKLKVHAFKDEASFDEYLSSALGDTRDGASYLHYSRPDRSELLLVRDNKPTSIRAFSHQAFIQFLRAFIPNPPAWMREGFAIFFEPLFFDASIEDFLLEENLAWLETVKSWGEDSPGIDRILLSDEDAGLGAERRNPASWALVSFILNSSNEEYRRFLYESILLLDSSSSASENALVLAKRGAAWIDAAQAKVDYSEYIASRKTFTELIEAGRNAYAAKDPQTAEKAFYAAEELKPGHYAPYYYLGLLAYERKDYALAENHYKSALQNGADSALVNYALGVNAAADSRNAEARKYLEQAKKASPERYSAKVDELIARLPE